MTKFYARFPAKRSPPPPLRRAVAVVTCHSMAPMKCYNTRDRRAKTQFPTAGSRRSLADHRGHLPAHCPAAAAAATRKHYYQ